MAITARIPQPLRNLTANQSVVNGSGATLASFFDDLERTFPGMRERLMDDTGQVRRFVNVYINGEDVRFMDGLATALSDGDEVSIVPAVAGG